MRITSFLVASLLVAAPSIVLAQSGMVHDMSSHDMASHAVGNTVDDTALPPDAEHSLARLNASPRHGQWVMIPTTASGDSMRAWIVYPERSTKAPVVIVIHEIFGMSTWVRAVTDQLAADGYIAIAPDMLSGQKLPGAPDSVSIQDGVTAVSKLKPADVQTWIDAVAKYGMALPSALHRYGIVGFCWGGGISFGHAVHSPTLGAAVVYYGTSPSATELASVKAPVLGLYGGSDARVVATVAPADSEMKAMHKIYDPHVFEGAGHGFLRAQAGNNGANMKATQQAWPATINWFRKYLGS